jgi:hypothetical protein
MSPHEDMQTVITEYVPNVPPDTDGGAYANVSLLQEAVAMQAKKTVRKWDTSQIQAALGGIDEDGPMMALSESSGGDEIVQQSLFLDWRYVLEDVSGIHACCAGLKPAVIQPVSFLLEVPSLTFLHHTTPLKAYDSVYDEIQFGFGQEFINVRPPLSLSLSLSRPLSHALARITPLVADKPSHVGLGMYHAAHCSHLHVLTPAHCPYPHTHRPRLA